MASPNKLAREAAFKAGKVRYYTGIPCKVGHIAERYVSNGGCVACVTPYVRTRNSYDKNAAPFHMPGLWVRNDYSDVQTEALRAYLQQCIDAFDRATCPHLPPLSHSGVPASVVTPTTAPAGTETLPSLESLPSAERGRARPPKCPHGIDEGFCEICNNDTEYFEANS
jgi:hypothetical protein